MGVRQQAIIDFGWGFKFGALDKFVFKYGNPWNYPALEFEELKTITTAYLHYKDLKAAGEAGPKIILPNELNIPFAEQELNQKKAKNMASYLSERGYKRT